MRGGGGYSAQCICGLTFIGVMLMTVTPPKGVERLPRPTSLSNWLPALPTMLMLDPIP